MSSHWPPEGYAAPSEYIVNERHALLTSFALFLPTLYLIYKSVRKSAQLFSDIFLPFVQETALSGNPLLVISLEMILAIIWVLFWGALTIAAHEGIHYITSLMLKLNPKFEWHWQFGFLNPSVVNYNAGISRWQNIVVLGGPFILISAISGFIVLISSGFVAGTSAVIFAINSAPSGNDIYNVIRLVQMPRGTVFANFRDNDELRTEYITPDSSGNRKLRGR